jgi:hypothetical protein
MTDESVMTPKNATLQLRKSDQAAAIDNSKIQSKEQNGALKEFLSYNSNHLDN